MKKIIAFLFISIFITGCASKTAVVKNYNINENQKFIAINLDVDAGRYIALHEAKIVNYIYKSFEDSNLFTNVETDFARHPITFQVNYSWEPHKENIATGLAKGAIAGASLLLIPAPLDEMHYIKVKVIAGNQVVKTLKYSEKVETALSLYHNPVEDRKNGINRMMSRLFNDVKEQRVIPTVSDMNNQQKPKKEISL